MGSGTTLDREEIDVRTRVAIAALGVLLLPSGAAAATGPVWALGPPVPVPDGATSSVLDDVTVMSPTDVWAVGWWTDADSHPLAVHWNGVRWTGAQVPPTVAAGEIYRLGAI